MGLNHDRLLTEALSAADEKERTMLDRRLASVEKRKLGGVGGGVGGLDDSLNAILSGASARVGKENGIGTGKVSENADFFLCVHRRPRSWNLLTINSYFSIAKTSVIHDLQL